MWRKARAGCPLQREAEITDYIAMLRQIPRYYDQQMANMRAGLARGFTPPRITMQGREESILPSSMPPRCRTIPSTPHSRPCPPVSPPRSGPAPQAAEAITQAVVPARQAAGFPAAGLHPHARTALDASPCPMARPIIRRRSANSPRWTCPRADPPDRPGGSRPDPRADAQVMQEVHFTGDLPAFLPFCAPIRNSM
jgi:hypothetical protein